MQKHTIDRNLITPGLRFDTYAERGCIAQSKPDIDGNFDGLDSDSVEVEFNIKMVSVIYPKQ